MRRIVELSPSTSMKGKHSEMVQKTYGNAVMREGYCRRSDATLQAWKLTHRVQASYPEKQVPSCPPPQV
eukprot:2724444-Pleurochrysis_carterae.AAC.3